MTASARLPLLLRLLQQIEFPRKLGICERLFAGRLSAQGVQWVGTGAGIVWKLDLRNATHRWIVYGKYEGAPFLDWAKKFLPPDGVVVDSGANIGQMLLYLSQWVPNGRLIAVEPGKHQADWLAECLGVHPKLPVELLRVGLGAERAQLFLEEPGASDRHGSWNRVSSSRGEAIEVVRLDELLRARDIRRVDLWKLDVEGYEIPALRGADDALREHRIAALYVELDGDNGRAIVRHLAERRYTLHVIDSRGGVSRSAKMEREHTNGLFLPDEAG